MTSHGQYIRTDIAAIADWMVHFLKAPHGAAGSVGVGIAADTGEDMIVLSFEGRDIALTVWEAQRIVRVMIRRDPTAASLCDAMTHAIEDIETRTMH